MNDRQYILSLVRQGEHQQQDFKYKVQDAAKLARSVSAFANTDGGRLLIGVRDDGNLSGVRSEEEIYMMHQAAYRYCRPEASIKFDTYHVVPNLPSLTGYGGTRTIVIATVPPSDRKPIFALDEEGRQRAYVRIADENIVASPVHLAIWRQQSSTGGLLMRYTTAEQQLLQTFSTDEPQTLNQVVHRSQLPRPKVITLLARLIRYNLVTCRFDGHNFLFAQ